MSKQTIRITTVQVDALKHLTNTSIRKLLISAKLNTAKNDKYILDIDGITFEITCEEAEKRKEEEQKIEMYTNLFKDVPEIENPENSRQLYDYITSYMVGQNNAVKNLISAIINNIHAKNSNEIMKPLIIGQTGSGKSYFFKLIKKVFDIPVVVIDCNRLVQAGYVGKSVDDALRDLYYLCDGDDEKMKTAIIYFDEVDKLASRGADVSDVGVQKSLLKFLEGSSYVIPLDLNRTKNVKIDTSMMTIVAGGAFSGLEDIVNKKERKIGFDQEKKDKFTFKYRGCKIKTEHFVEYGMIPEFIGRFNLPIVYNDLTKEMIKEQLEHSKSSPLLIKQDIYKRDYNITLEFKPEFIDIIVNNAYENQTGFRGIETEINEVLVDLLFDVQSGIAYGQTVTVGAEIFEDTTDYEINHVKVKKKNR